MAFFGKGFCVNPNVHITAWRQPCISSVHYDKKDKILEAVVVVSLCARPSGHCWARGTGLVNLQWVKTIYEATHAACVNSHDHTMSVQLT